MAWLKGLAGKAEDLLNQIDQNAAVALQKDKKDAGNNEPLLTEVTWEGQQVKRDGSNPPRYTPPPTRPATNGGGISTVKSSPNLALRSPTRAPKTSSDDELLKFLNSSGTPTTSSAEEKITVKVNGHVPVESRKFSPIVVEPDNERSPRNVSQASSRRSSPRDEPVQISVEPTLDNVPAGLPTSEERAAELKTENGFLKNELRSLNNEMSLLLQRTKAAEKENWSLQQQLTNLQASQKQTAHTLKEREELVARLEKELQDIRQQTVAAQDLAQGLQLENSRLVQDSMDSSGQQSQALQALQDRLAEKEEELETLQRTHRQELKSLQDRMSSLESERTALTTQLSDLQHQVTQSEAATRDMQQQWERVRAELAVSCSELDQYRARAQRILQDKEKLIAELKGQGGSSSEHGSAVDDTVELELEQLRQERELLREEVAQVSARLKASRDELQETERRLESGREQANQSLQLLQDSLQEERKKRQAAEEDCKTHAEELRSVREELSRQRAQLASRVRERETELTRLRSQLAQRPASPHGDELESRLHALTQTLVQKQSSLETVTTERNALRLQLEKMEHKHQDTLALLHQMQSGPGSVNDTDDAKARVPTFLVESPFDTGVTRRVKRAYSSLDAVSIRTGVFLRRYPLARIFVFVYMVCLHLWVMVVLLSYTPSEHT